MGLEKVTGSLGRKLRRCLGFPCGYGYVILEAFKEEQTR